MLKLKHIIAIIGFIAVGFALPSAVFAEKNYWEVPTRDHLEVSLMSLRDRALKIQQRNEWLIVENHKLKSLMDQMDQDLKDLQAHNSALDGSLTDYDNNVRDMSLVEKRALRANMSMSQLQSEYRRIMTQFHVKQEQESILKGKINELTAVIDEWNQEKQAKRVDINGNASEISRYQVLVENSIKSLAKAEQEHRQIQNKYERPLQEIFRLNRTKNDLTSQVNLLDDELSVFTEEKNILTRQMDEVAQNRQKDIAELEENIKQLAEKKSELDTILVRAQQKIKMKNVEFSPDNDQYKNLANNLNIVKEENLALQDEMTSLQRALQKIDSLK